MSIQLVTNDVSCGLELEYEGVCSLETSELIQAIGAREHLGAKRDGSLRPSSRNTEIVFRQPMAGREVIRALEYIGRLAEELPYVLSWRTGMHCHVDIRGTSARVAPMVAILTSIMEETFFAWDGTGRQENKFCQPVSGTIVASCRNNGQWSKYSSVNVNSMWNLGSVEYRFASSTLDVPRMAEFINICLASREVAFRYDSADELLLSILSAPSLAEWIADNYHPLVADTLASFAVNEISAPSLFAASEFCDIDIETPVYGQVL